MCRLSTVKALAVIVWIAISAAFAVDGVAITSSYPNFEASKNSEGNDILNNDIVRLNIVDSKVSGSPVLLVSKAGREHLSPDGQMLAFVKWIDVTRSMLCIMSINGGAPTELCEVHSYASVDFPNNQYVYFGGGGPERECNDVIRGPLGGELSGEIWRIDINTKVKEKMVTLYNEGDTNRVTRSAGGDFDVSYNLSRICFRTSNTNSGISCTSPTRVIPPFPKGSYVVFDMINKRADGTGILYLKNSVACGNCIGGDGQQDNSCGGGMSYDGLYVFDGYINHTGYDVRDAGNMGNLIKHIGCGNEHKPNQAGGACNNADWICRTIGDAYANHLKQSLFNWRTGEQIITGNGDGGDFWVGSVSTTPAMILSPGTLAYTVIKGAANPSAQNITVSNSGTGTLNAVTTSKVYDTGTPTGWLTTAVTGGATNSQTIANTVALGTLDTGTYTVTVTVTCLNTTPAISRYTVSLRINPVPLNLTSITVSPAVCTTYTRSMFEFTAVGKNAAGVALVPQPAFTWSVSGQQTIGANGVFTSGITAGGPYTVTAAVSGKNSTAAVSVVRPITITAPAATPVRRVGDTLVISWIKPATIQTGGLQVSFSADGGLTWSLISGNNYNGAVIANSLISDNTPFYAGTTGTFKWIIPAMVGDAGTISTLSTTCKIQLEDPYATTAHRKINDQSAAFAIGATGVVTSASRIHAGGLYQIINGMNSLSVAINTAAAHTLEITAVNGTRIFHASGSGRADYTIGRKAAGVGVYIVRINADGREFTGRIIVN